MSATISSPAAQRWLPRLLSGHPHQVIRTSAGDPYLLRWFLVPPNKYCQVYGHRFIGSDEPTPHDHPWHFVSIVLQGRYFEESVSRGGPVAHTGAYRVSARYPYPSRHARH